MNVNKQSSQNFNSDRSSGSNSWGQHSGGGGNSNALAAWAGTPADSVIPAAGAGPRGRRAAVAGAAWAQADLAAGDLAAGAAGAVVSVAADSVAAVGVSNHCSQ